MDMVDLFENSMKQLGHGLKYEFIGDQIVFYGRLKDQMKDKTLVVQITTKRGWILREILIQGSTSTSDHSVIDFIQEELQSKDNNGLYDNFIFFCNVDFFEIIKNV